MMKQLLRRFAFALAMLLAIGFVPAQAQTVAPKTLVLYDAPPGTQFEKLGFSYAIMLRNLLGHFDAQVDLVPVQNYTAGKVNAYDATFYLGAYYDNAMLRPPPRRWSGSSTTCGARPGTRPTPSSRRAASAFPACAG
jgi:hypothetical protein